MAAANKASIWIKEGHYAPKEKTQAIAAFVLYDGVKLYGGFKGDEKSPGDRNIKDHETVLSAKGEHASYNHVLYGADDTIIDELVIEGGNAEGYSYHGCGGGLLAYHAGKPYSPFDKNGGTGFKMVIRKSIFRNNTAREGAAIYAFSKADLTISDTQFVNNTANYGGAIVDREGNHFQYNKCVFSGNHATDDGGATYEDYGSQAVYKNCTFTDNKADSRGGAIYVISRASQLGGTQLTLKNCTFNGNTAHENSDICNFDNNAITIEK